MPNKLTTNPVHLGLGGTASSEPAFSGMNWYEAYGARHAEDGAEGRLVSQHSFTEPWDSWEMHPNGSEVVLCVGGTLTLIQELPSGVLKTALSAGEYAINAPGVWHTVDAEEAANAVFITSGLGTEHRPR